MNTVIARRYAHALFSLVRRDDCDATLEGLQALSRALKDSPALKHSLASPAVTPEEKLDVLTALCDRTGGPPVMRRFCRQLLNNNRLGAASDIAGAFGELLARERGRRRVDVVSARPMDDGMKEDLRARLRSMAHRDVEIDFHADPSLLSGLRIRIGSAVYDSTVKGQLNRMRTQLAKG